MVVLFGKKKPVRQDAAKNGAGSVSLLAYQKELKEGREVIFSDVEVDKEEVNHERFKPGKGKAVRKGKGYLLKVILKCQRGKEQFPSHNYETFQAFSRH